MGGDPGALEEEIKIEDAILEAIDEQQMAEYAEAFIADLPAPFTDDLSVFIANLLCDEDTKEEIEAKLRSHRVQQVQWLDGCGIPEWQKEFGLDFYQATIMVRTLNNRRPRLAGYVSIFLVFLMFLYHKYKQQVVLKDQVQQQLKK